MPRAGDGLEELLEGLNKKKIVYSESKSRSVSSKIGWIISNRPLTNPDIVGNITIAKNYGALLKDNGLSHELIVKFCLDDLIENREEYGEFVLSSSCSWNHLAKVLIDGGPLYKLMEMKIPHLLKGEILCLTSQMD